MPEEAFREDIKIELENLERLTEEMKQLLSGIGDTPSFIEIRAAGSIIHDFYCGTEKIFERIALHIDKSLPQGENWHTELLLQMAKPLNGVRRAIITEGLLQDLKEYLRFRHLFRNIYGFELKWERFKEFCIRLEDIFRDLKFKIEKFFNRLRPGLTLS